jgi:hypothetical protein
MHRFVSRPWAVLLLTLLGLEARAAVPTSSATVAPSRLPPDVARFFEAAPGPRRLPPPRIVEGIEILGNERTAPGVIRAYLSVRPGRVVEASEIEASRIRLLSSGFFRRVEFSLRRGSARGRVIVVVTVEERNTLRIEDLAFGFGPGHAPFLALGLAETNFLGRGVTVAGAAAVGEGRRGGELRIFLPNLSGTRLQLSGSLLWMVGQEAIAPRLDPDASPLEYERRGGTLGLGFGSGPAQRISLVYRIEGIDAERLPNLDPPVLRRAPSILFDSSVLSTLSATWERDTRDDAFAPRRGTRLAAAVEVGTSLLGSDYEFSKYTAELQRAFHVHEGQALLLYAFGGLVQGETPFFNQFFRRDFSHFSYGVEALPRAVGINFSRANDYDDLLLDVGAEYTLPLLRGWGPIARLLLYGAADFTISGSLDEAQEDADGRGVFGPFPLTFDAGLKLDTDFGRFTLSLAYALDLAL